MSAQIALTTSADAASSNRGSRSFVGSRLFVIYNARSLFALQSPIRTVSKIYPG